MSRKIIVITFFLLLIFVSSCGLCPTSCNDNNPCTKDSCSSDTKYKCKHDPIAGQPAGCTSEGCLTKQCIRGVCSEKMEDNCCGNDLCELGENTFSCETDCKACTGEECNVEGLVGIEDCTGKYCVDEIKEICKLTGPGSLNDNSFVKGTTLGIFAKDQAKSYMFFGDTSSKEGEHRSDYSNIFAETNDNLYDDCFTFKYVSMKEVYLNRAEFFARESDMQGIEELREGDISDSISQNYSGYYYWAVTQDKTKLLNELVKKQNILFDYYFNKSDFLFDNETDLLSDYYARLSVRLADIGVTFSNDKTKPTTLNSADYNYYYDLVSVQNETVKKLKDDTKIRFTKIFDAIDNKEIKQIGASKISLNETAVVPTGAVYVNTKMYVYFMSIKEWGNLGDWDSNYAGIYYSGDKEVFKRADNIFDNVSNFIQNAPVKSEGYVYILGTPKGRLGDVKLARVKQENILEKKDYEFCELSTSTKCSWVRGEKRASVIIKGPIGEHSVQWNTKLKKWMIMYHDVNMNQIIIRYSDNLYGPWSEPYSIFDCNSDEYQGCYAPYLFTEPGEEFYFTMTLYPKNNVYLFKGRYA